MTAIPEVVARAADVGELHARAREVCARLNRDHAELVEITAELIESELWAGVGIRSPEHWLIVRAGLSPGRARDIVLLARRRTELPETTEALMAGRVSVDQAAVVARHVPATHSRAAQELAENASVTQLRRVLPRYSFTDGEPQPDPEPLEEESTLQMATAEGRFTLRYAGPAAQGALIEAAIREAKDRLFRDGQTDATLADGMVEVANRSLGAIESSSRVDKFRIYVHLDTEGGWISRGGRLPKHMVDRLTCDGVLQPVWETEGHPVNVGRAHRIVPRRTRRLVEARDRGCRYPGCSTSGGHVEVHHIRHWRDDGESNTWELVCLCAFHHDAHHRGEFAIAGDADEGDGLRFTGRGGWLLTPLVRSLHSVDEPTTGPDRTPPQFRGPTGRRLDRHQVDLAPNHVRPWQAWTDRGDQEATEDDGAPRP